MIFRLISIVNNFFPKNRCCGRKNRTKSFCLEGPVVRRVGVPEVGWRSRRVELQIHFSACSRCRNENEKLFLFFAFLRDSVTFGFLKKIFNLEQRLFCVKVACVQWN